MIDVKIGQVYILQTYSFNEFDKGKKHPKLNFEKEPYYSLLLPGTSLSKKDGERDFVITIQSKEFDIKSELFKYTHFLYNFRRKIPNNEIILKGKIIGGPTPKIIEEINRFKSKIKQNNFDISSITIDQKSKKKKKRKKYGKFTTKLGDFFQKG